MVLDIDRTHKNFNLPFCRTSKLPTSNNAVNLPEIHGVLKKNFFVAAKVTCMKDTVKWSRLRDKNSTLNKIKSSLQFRFILIS